MAPTESIENLQKGADALGFRFGVTKSGKLWILDPPTKNASTAAFKKRLIAAKPLIVTSKSTPAVVKGELKKAGNDSWLEGLNNKINQYRDRYVMPTAESAGGFVGRHSWLADLPGVNTPEDATKLGSGIAREGVKTLMPDEFTGKAINTALAFLPGGEEMAPEVEAALGPVRRALTSTRGRVLAPALVGGIAGGASGEGTIPGVGQGLVAGAAGELPRAPKGAIARGRQLGQAERQYRLNDVVPGRTISPVLRLKSFDDGLEYFGNWVRALKHPRVNEEAGSRYSEGMQNVEDSIRAYALQKAHAVVKAFNDKIRVPLRRTGYNYTDETYRLYASTLEQVKKFREDANQLVKAMREERLLRRATHTPKGDIKDTALKESTTLGGQTPLEKYNQVSGDVRSGLQQLDPRLAASYDKTKEEYRIFKGFESIADIKGAIMSPSGHVDLDVINHELDANPDPYYRRIGRDNFDSVRQMFRNYSPAKPDYAAGETYFDQPGALEKVRAIYYGAKGHLAATAATVGEVAPQAAGGAGSPLLARPLGVPIRQPVKPGRIPRLITGAGANEAIDYGRESSATP